MKVGLERITKRKGIMMYLPFLHKINIARLLKGENLRQCGLHIIDFY